MLRAATLKSTFKHAEAQASILWIISKANKLANYRNDAIHSPYAFVVCTENLSSGVVVVKSAKDGV
jgi:hypothetical protein